MSEMVFTHVVPLRNIVVGERQVFIESKPYEIEATFQRGSYTIDGENMYFAQTTLVVVNETGEKMYIPYLSGNFSKVRGVRAGAATAV